MPVIRWPGKAIHSVVIASCTAKATASHICVENCREMSFADILSPIETVLFMESDEIRSAANLARQSAREEKGDWILAT
jgi:hypothetical protein